MFAAAGSFFTFPARLAARILSSVGSRGISAFFRTKTVGKAKPGQKEPTVAELQTAGQNLVAYIQERVRTNRAYAYPKSPFTKLIQKDNSSPPLVHTGAFIGSLRYRIILGRVQLFFAPRKLENGLTAGALHRILSRGAIIPVTRKSRAMFRLRHGQYIKAGHFVIRPRRFMRVLTEEWLARNPKFRGRVMLPSA